MTTSLHIPDGEERLRCRREGIEYIGVFGYLEVPVEKTWDPTPVRPGWEPFFVCVNLDASPQKWVSYKRTEAPTSDALWQAYKNGLLKAA